MPDTLNLANTQLPTSSEGELTRWDNSLYYVKGGQYYAVPLSSFAGQPWQDARGNWKTQQQMDAYGKAALQSQYGINFDTLSSAWEGIDYQIKHGQLTQGTSANWASILSGYSAPAGGATTTYQVDPSNPNKYLPPVTTPAGQAAPPSTGQLGITPEQYTQNILGGQYTTMDKAKSLYPGLATTEAISVDAFSPVAPAPLVPQQPPNQTATGLIAGAEQGAKTLQDSITEATPPETDLSAQIKGLWGDVMGALPGLQGRGAAQAEAETATGVPTYSKELANMNAQILQKVAENKATQAQYQKLSQAQEGQAGVTMARVIGSQAQIQKMALAEQNAAAADVGLLQARALGLQGQLEAAQKTADRAVDLMYQDREAVINTKLKQLELLLPELAKQEKIYAEAQANKLKDEKEKLKEQKDTTKANITLAIANNVATQFYNFGGEIRSTATGRAFSTEQEFVDATGMNVAQAEAKGLITMIGGGVETSQQMVGSATTGYRLITYDKQGNIVNSTPVSGGGGGGGGGLIFTLPADAPGNDTGADITIDLGSVAGIKKAIQLDPTLTYSDLFAKITQANKNLEVSVIKNLLIEAGLKEPGEASDVSLTREYMASRFTGKMLENSAIEIFIGKGVDDDDLKAEAKKRGLRKWNTSWEAEKEILLEALKVEYMDYIMELIEGYRNQGLTDDEILKQME